MDIPILYECGDFLALEKPTGIATVQERKPGVDCLIEHVNDRTGKKHWVVHRLDKEVSGIVVFAKNAAAHRRLSLMFERREMEKEYAAVVHGTLAPESGIIDAALRQYGSGRMGVDEPSGKSSQTEYQTLSRIEGYSVVKLFPKTGRRHQLRVHLYHIGHAIVGDPLYGDREQQKNHPRLMLHASRLNFLWDGNDAIQILSSIPNEFKPFQSS